MFFIPKKKLVLHCYTQTIGLVEMAPIEKASKFLPSWWKELPKNFKVTDDIKNELSIRKGTTLKSCSGFTDLYSKGAILPMWSDVTIQIGEIGNNSYRFYHRDNRSVITIHPQMQRGNYLPDTEYQHLKFVSPWVFYCEEPTNFVFMEPTWNLEDLQYTKTLPGIVNYKYQHTTSVNMMCIRKPEAYEFDIPFLHPMAHIIPMDDRELEIKVSCDEDKYKFYSELNRTRATYRTLKKIKQDNEKKGCPFGFGR
jgi:hypothetical protein